MQASGRPGTTIGRLGRSTTVLLALVAIVAIVAACSNNQGGGNPTSPLATQPAASSAASSPPAATPPAAGGAVELALAKDADLGDYVTGADGMALYVFLPDEGKDTSQCTGGCATNWPPLTVADAAEASAGDGVTGEVGTVTRADGTLQVTLGGAPLYYYVADQQAGDVKGQGVNDVWYLASPAGEPVGAGNEPAPQESSCGRYCY